MCHQDRQYRRNTDQLLDYSAAADLLKMPRPTLRRLVAMRRIPHVRLGPRSVRFRIDALLAWLDEHAVAVVPSAGVDDDA